MLRTRLLTATAAVALFAAPAAFAQSTTTTAPETPAEMPATSPATAPAAAATPAPAATQAASAQTPATAGNIIDTLKAKGEFSTLLAALESAQLTETLRTQPAISIFAPTDAAFAELPEADRTRLMDPANAQELRQLLLYHVVVADVSSSQIEGTKGGVETAARTQVQLDGTGDAIKVDDATVTTADIDASNGAIFVIDKVLSPGASQVASGDAEEDAAAPAEDVPAATPPVTPPAEAAPAPTPPASTTMDEDTTEAAPPAGEAEMTPPADDATTTPPVAAPTASAPSAMAPSSMAPSSMTPSTTMPPAPTPPVEGDPDSDDMAPTPSPTPAPKPAPAPAPVPTPQG